MPCMASADKTSNDLRMSTGSPYSCTGIDTPERTSVTHQEQYQVAAEI